MALVLDKHESQDESQPAADLMASALLFCVVDDDDDVVVIAVAVAVAIALST